MAVTSIARRPFGDVFREKRVLVTGHTGFKGSWLCEWLLELGAQVIGFSLAPPTSKALFDQLGLAARLRDIRGDVRDNKSIQRAIREARPDFLFHLAAQPLVRLSYVEPVETYATNIMGTVHLLDAVRRLSQPCTVVIVTSDKCYENREWVHSYREEDPIGGRDPYSSSKGAAELVIDAYRRSYFSDVDSPVRVASVRAGNVIGGGDWARDRIVPDCVRALRRSEPIAVRNLTATRPWQHVLEPLGGYLWLAAKLAAEPRASSGLASAFNFGPSLASNRTVADLVLEILKHCPGRWEDRSDPKGVHEAKLLNLAIDKAWHLLGWQPAWDFATTVSRTMEWYQTDMIRPMAVPELTQAQIASYVSDARRSNITWPR